MAKKLPNFDEMAEWYPAEPSADEVKEYIGGDVNQAHYKNTCIMRVSWSLNYAGHPIPRDSGWFRTKQGEDKKWYGLRVNEFWSYMTKIYGAPAIYERKGKNGVIPIEKFIGKRGIIGFRAKFTDATGHFTLWNGIILLRGSSDTNYWFAASEAALWIAE